MDLQYVMKRIEAGAKIRFYEDFYGKQWIEINQGWLPFLKRRIQFPNDTIMEIKDALVKRRRAKSVAQTRH